MCVACGYFEHGDEAFDATDPAVGERTSAPGDLSLEEIKAMA